MTSQPATNRAAERRAATLAVVIAVQGLCALVFIGDFISELGAGEAPSDMHLGVEIAAALALLAGVAYLSVELRRLLARMGGMETGLRAARGEMLGVIEEAFDRWRLSAAERDVAMLLLKGLDNDAIAELRGRAKGTVRAQTAAIYAKAEVTSRAQFVSQFLEELLAPLPAQDAAAAAPPPRKSA